MIATMPARPPLRERSVPFDVQAERATLGSVLLERDALVAIADQVGADDFYLEKHAIIYGAMLACLARREPPDLATVAAELRRREQLDLVGGLPALSDLALEVPAAVHVEYYAATVRRAATLRRLIVAGGEIAALGYDETREIDETLDAAEQALLAVSQGAAARADAATTDMAGLAHALWGHIGAVQAGDEPPGVGLGWPELDQKLLLRPGNTYLIAARPGVGKTALMLNVFASLAQRGYRAGVYSLEMARIELAQRLAAMLTGLDADRVARAQLDTDELCRVQEALGEIAEWPGYLTDRADLSGTGLRVHARRQHMRAPVDVLLIDYLQLIIPHKAENRQVAVSEISAGLKRLARELNVPIVALSQLSRAVEGRADKVPDLSDLRESGSLEQDASGVLMLHRPELTDPRTDRPGAMDVYIRKNRGGRVGSVALHYDTPTQRITGVERYRAQEGY